jgi:hypothetical protein
VWTPERATTNVRRKGERGAIDLSLGRREVPTIGQYSVIAFSYEISDEIERSHEEQ